MLNLAQFYRACNPSKTLALENPEDRQYYVDFSQVRGGNVIQQVQRTITLLSPDDPTCQLFTGHIGCGKSTELLKLKYELEQTGWHVIYFESTRDLEMNDVDVTDVLLAVARQVSDSLHSAGVGLQASGFKALLQGALKLLKTEIDFSAEANVPGLGQVGVSSEDGISLSLGIGKLTAKTKDSPELRSQLRQYLEPRTKSIIEAINNELLIPAKAELQRRGKQGLVVIVDNLDRISNIPKPWGTTQPEYLFIERGEQLKRLHCHMLYTVPLVLLFSNDASRLTNQFGEAKMLPMVQVQRADGQPCADGIALLRQMVLARAFPALAPAERLARISEVFDAPETLDRLCTINGGHMRETLNMLYSCLQRQDPPLARATLETVVQSKLSSLAQQVEQQEWALIRDVAARHWLSGEEQYTTLLRSKFVFEYQDASGKKWFDINPLLREAEMFQER